jgi:uncharacterized protein YndB with AHSA1/START domain
MSPRKAQMDRILHHSARLRCDAQHAFDLFTVNKLIESWLTPLAEVEAIAGGKYELFWEPDDKENNSTLGCRITAIEPRQLVSFEWRSPKQFKHFANTADPLTHVVVFFIPCGEWTQVHLVHSGWRSSAEWEEARLWQGHAWRGAFEELEKLVNDEDI